MGYPTANLETFPQSANFAIFPEIITAKSGFVSYWQQNLLIWAIRLLVKLLASRLKIWFWQAFFRSGRQNGSLSDSAGCAIFAAGAFRTCLFQPFRLPTV
ncbi:MAG: hypothetical protein IPH12_20870 [Saprospirales bacterium]|nr:hypothetical protein [Saprospirales bacterium]MBK8922004.1 hypothetical protein [Saprospirales bacterium]